MVKMYYKSKVSNHFPQIMLNCLYVSFFIAIIFSTSRYCLTKLCKIILIQFTNIDVVSSNR